jgi:hypothetical protein
VDESGLGALCVVYRGGAVRYDIPLIDPIDCIRRFRARQMQQGGQHIHL